MKQQLLKLVVMLPLCGGLLGCDQTPKPKWGNGVPDSYDPAVDGPVWLGPYRFTEPKGLQWGTGIRILTFQLQVLENKVSYFGGGIPIEGAWLSYHTMTYDTPSGPPGSYDNELKVDLSNRAIEFQWNPPATIIAQMNGITTLDRTPISFTCYVAIEDFATAFPTRDMTRIWHDDSPGRNCRTFTGIVPGVRTLIDFPLQELKNAHLFVPEMILLLRTTVTEK